MKRIRELIELPVAEHVECVGSLHGLIKYNLLWGVYLAIIFNLCQSLFMNGGSLQNITFCGSLPLFYSPAACVQILLFTLVAAQSHLPKKFSYLETKEKSIVTQQHTAHVLLLLPAKINSADVAWVWAVVLMGGKDDRGPQTVLERKVNTFLFLYLLIVTMIKWY